MSRLRSDARAVRAAVSSGSRRGVSVLKRLLIFYLAAMLVLWVFICILFICLWLAGASALLLRYYTLSRVPGNHVIPLTFNAMPLHTEWWRNKAIDDAMTHFITSIEQTGDGRLSDGSTGSSLCGLQGTPEENGGNDDLHRKAHQERLQLCGGGTAGGAVVQTQAGKLLDFKLSFLQQFVDSILATSTLLISTGKTKTLFLPGGTVNMEAIFDNGSPMFNAPGVYSGRAQLVFLREDIGRDVSVVVESAMLFAEDARSPQTLWSLDVLFQRSHTLNVRTGELPRPWLLRAAAAILRMCLFVPMKFYELSVQLVRDSRSAPFPPIDHRREVAVSVDLYERFTPPPSLQSRLRAMNFTVYYNHLHEGSATQLGKMYRRPVLARMTFFSHVQLRGLAYYLAMYPVVSFILMACTIFAVYAATALSCAALAGVALYLRFFTRTSDVQGGERRKGAAGDRGGDDKLWWAFDSNNSFSSSGLSPTNRPPSPSFSSSGVGRRGLARAASAGLHPRHPSGGTTNSSNIARRRDSSPWEQSGAAHKADEPDPDAGPDSQSLPATEAKKGR